jgi:hypothetical protein
MSTARSTRAQLRTGTSNAAYTDLDSPTAGGAVVTEGRVPDSMHTRPVTDDSESE